MSKPAWIYTNTQRLPCKIKKKLKKHGKSPCLHINKIYLGHRATTASKQNQQCLHNPCLIKSSWAFNKSAETTIHWFLEPFLPKFCEMNTKCAKQEVHAFLTICPLRHSQCWSWLYTQKVMEVAVWRKKNDSLRETYFHISAHQANHWAMIFRLSVSENYQNSKSDAS